LTTEEKVAIIELIDKVMNYSAQIIDTSTLLSINSELAEWINGVRTLSRKTSKILLLPGYFCGEFFYCRSVHV